MVIALEVCVESLDSALAADEGGACRVELCSSLEQGGITPSHGLIRQVCKALQRTHVHVLIRPRPGDFLYSAQEIEVMWHDTLHAIASGVHGIVLGMLTEQGRVATDQLRPFVELCNAAGVGLTFHRAFDVVRDQRKALEDLMACGVRRVLTSGGRQSVMEGLAQIAELVVAASGKLSVMPGGGVTEENVCTVVKVTGVSEVHGSFRHTLPSGMRYQHPEVRFAAGGADHCRAVADAAVVARVRQKLDQLQDEIRME